MTRHRRVYEAAEDPEILDWGANARDAVPGVGEVVVHVPGPGGSLEPEPDSQALAILSILRRHRIRALLRGGQACILYGGVEFSRDIDLAVVSVDEATAAPIPAVLIGDAGLKK